VSAVGQDSLELGHAPPPPVVHYTCPMHPEVDSVEPGQCPKCGMTLVRAPYDERDGAFRK
jgi:hypothetical protein